MSSWVCSPFSWVICPCLCSCPWARPDPHPEGLEQLLPRCPSLLYLQFKVVGLAVVEVALVRVALSPVLAPVSEASASVVDESYLENPSCLPWFPKRKFECWQVVPQKCFFPCCFRFLETFFASLLIVMMLSISFCRTVGNKNSLTGCVLSQSRWWSLSRRAFKSSLLFCPTWTTTSPKILTVMDIAFLRSKMFNSMPLGISKITSSPMRSFCSSSGTLSFLAVSSVASTLISVDQAWTAEPPAL